MTRRLLLTLATAAGTLLATPPLATTLQGQDSRTVVLRFRKAGDTTAIRGALITIDHTIEAGLTDANGTVTIPDLEDGGHIVEAVAKGYQAFFDKFTSGPTIRMPIDLEILAVVAAPKPKGAATTLTPAGFEQRRAKGGGRFFTLAQMKAANGRPLANFLQIDAGAYLATGPGGESLLASRALSRGSTPCYAAVVRDGLRVYPFENATPPNLDRLFTDDIGTIELYSTTPPAEFRDVGRCGVLVLWSR